jgi:hypothetical protein
MIIIKCRYLRGIDVGNYRYLKSFLNLNFCIFPKAYPKKRNYSEFITAPTRISPSDDYYSEGASPYML